MCTANHTTERNHCIKPYINSYHFYIRVHHFYTQIFTRHYREGTRRSIDRILSVNLFCEFYKICKIGTFGLRFFVRLLPYTSLTFFRTRAHHSSLFWMISKWYITILYVQAHILTLYIYTKIHRVSNKA